MIAIEDRVVTPVSVFNETRKLAVSFTGTDDYHKTDVNQFM